MENMEYWKAPGPDGITTDIFRKIALDIKVTLESILTAIV